MPRTIVDLTFPIHEGMTTYPRPWHPVVEVSQMGRHGVEGRETRKVILGTHTGTHVDAPRHFIPGGESVDNLPLDVLIGPASMLDLRDLPPRTEVGQELLASRLTGPCPERLLLCYGWSSRFEGMGYYKEFPHLSTGAAQWLAAQGVKLLGLDTAMADDPHPAEGAPDSPIHKILLSSGVVLVEYLCNLEILPFSGFDVIIMPLKLMGADGAPARCAAVIEE